MRANIVLAGAAVVLAPFTVATYCEEAGSYTEFDRIPRLFEGFTEENVQYVVLSKLDEAAGEEPVPGPEGQEAPPRRDRLLIVKEDEGEWVLGEGELAGVPVRASKVEDDVLVHLRQIRRDEKALVQVDANEEQLARRGLTEDQAILVEAGNAERRPLAELLVGKDASGGEFGQNVVRGFFVARKGNNDIILYEPTATYWNLTVEPKDWVDTKIHQFETDRVQTFSLRNAHGEITFTREGEEGARKWKAENPPEGVGAVRQSEVDNLVSRFSYMSVQRYLGDVRRDPELAAKAPGPEAATMQVGATLDEGETHVLRVYEKIPDQAEYYARFEGADHDVDHLLTAVGDWVVTGFDKDIEDLFDPPAEAVGPEKDETGQGESGSEGEQEPGEPGEPGEESSRGGTGGKAPEDG